MHVRYEILCVVFQVPDIWDGADLRSLPTAAVYGDAVRLSSCISNQPRGLYDPAPAQQAGSCFGPATGRCFSHQGVLFRTCLACYHGDRGVRQQISELCQPTAPASGLTIYRLPS